MRSARHVSVALAVLVGAAALAGCGGGSKRDTGPAVAPSGPTETVIALGSSATEGDGVRNRLQDAWPYLVFHNSLPESTAFVNGALDGATIARAIDQQVPLAQELKPDIVEVWLGVDDLIASTPIETFQSEFTDLIAKLQADGSKRILVADLPAAYGPKAAAYNQAIAAAVSSTHAELVSLASAKITLAPTDGLPPQPDAASHRVIADAFAKQIAKPPAP